ncbi:hypothetical protein [Dietzia sp. PP-33]|mgnify:CR=1 FL=1|jgi:hypothetical protein|uniref:hypothetical protein n=1 Tax=Dietzia sp. PP-33 TaxID=2957500 RepID=UPI0029AB1E96|nr:hypothetical protein [Dietzia sp. PP-33]MDX2356887.1 hypothetical protein [Dietzia sp. PP-33]
MSTVTDDTLTAAERRYEKSVARLSTSLRSWRTPERRRLLVRLNWACVAVMAAIAVAGFFWFPIVIAWLPMTVAICTVWTMLRTVIDVKDSAPARYLDEFETQTLLRARSTALSVLVGICMVIGLVLVYGSTVELGDGHRLGYAMGGIAILAVFVGGIIPAAAMATTMDPVDPADPADS